MGRTIDRTSSAIVASKKRVVITWIVASLFILLAIAYFGIGALAASQLTLPQRVFDSSLNPGAFNLKYEDLQIPARNDNLSIAAWYIPSDQNQRALILVHGMNDSRTKGFVSQFVPFAQKLHAAGFSVLMIDLRGHGQSADSRFYFGTKERWDVLGGVDWLIAHGYQAGKVGVLGYSLGAASVIGAAAEEPAVGAIWVDSPIAEVKSLMERNWTKLSGLPQALLYPTEWMVRLLYGYDIASSRPIDEIGKIAPRPIFMAHCKEDQFIPLFQMEELAQRAKNPQIWIIQNCDQNTLPEPVVPEAFNNHAIGYYFQPDEYAQKVITFFDNNIK